MAMNDPVPGNAQARRRLWLSALHQLALADGDFSASEQELLGRELAAELPGVSWDSLHLPGDEALRHRFGVGTPLAEEFMRTAVMVALADGHLSSVELEWLQRWSRTLKVAEELIAGLASDGSASHCDSEAQPTLLEPLRQWMDDIQPTDPAVARFLVRLIPAQCPFERDVTLFGRKVVHIPPMCKINPLYDQLVGLRFRCLSRLEEVGGPETSPATP